MILDKTKKLTNGNEMPRPGLDVWCVEDGSETTGSVKWALEVGYRLTDTAAVYKNEIEVGEGARQSGIPCEEIFVTTKLWNGDQGYEDVIKAFDKSLKKLRLNYAGLYLTHWPVAGKYKEPWKALEEIYAGGRAKAIGVSNFHQHHPEDLLTEVDIVPIVDQIRLHPTLAQGSLRKCLAENRIAVEVWSPLGQGDLLSESVLVKIGGKYGKSVARVVIRWHSQNDTIVVPKSVHKKRVQGNFTVFGSELTPEEMTVINQSNKGHRLGVDPGNFDF